MAGHVVIERYLETLTQRMRWHPNAEDTIAELKDHLHSTAESLARDGMDTESAQQEAVRRAGDPRLVALELATTARGTLAMPTRFTRNIGIVAIVGALAWAAALIAWWTAALIGRPTGVHMVWTESTPGYEVYQAADLFFTLATVGLLATMAGLHRRHGGLGTLGWSGMIVVFYAIQIALFTQSSAMAFQAWGTVTTLGTLLFSMGLYRRDLIPRATILPFWVGGLLGTAVWVSLRVLAGPHHEWGGLLAQYWTINLVAVTIGVFLLAVGMVKLGLWLRHEEPADLLGHTQAILT